MEAQCVPPILSRTSGPTGSSGAISCSSEAELLIHSLASLVYGPSTNGRRCECGQPWGLTLRPWSQPDLYVRA